MDYPGIEGFLGTRASLMLDVVFLAMFAVLPVMGWSIYQVRYRQRYRLHKRVQIALGVILAVAVGPSGPPEWLGAPVIGDLDGDGALEILLAEFNEALRCNDEPDFSDYLKHESWKGLVTDEPLRGPRKRAASPPPSRPSRWPSSAR